MYYPCSENKDADQLRGHREADLRLCFRIGRLLVFSRTGSYIYIPLIHHFYIAKLGYKGVYLFSYFCSET